MRDRVEAALREERHPYALALFDVDLFVPFREQFGDTNAAEVLVAIERTLAAAVPKGRAAISHVDDDSFLAVFPGASLHDGLELAERMRAAVARTELRLHGVGSVAGSVSAGVVEVDGLRSADDVLADAQAALLYAKNSGRNCVATADRVDLLRDARALQLRHSWRPRREPPLGRTAELARLEHLLEHERFLTLTGGAGAGKTRLATALAAQSAGRFPDGIFFISLSEVTDALRAPIALAQGLGVRQNEPGAATSALVSLLRTQRALLIVDDCTFVASACAGTIAALLDGAPGVSVVATSDSPLGAVSERAVAVGALDPESAAALFRLHAHGLDDGADVDAACRRLGFNPLAIEILACTPRAQTLDELCSTLPQPGSIDELLTWRYERLDAAERALLPRLAVFAGGFTASDAAAVCNLGGTPVPATLRRLAEARLVGAQTHFRLPRRVREWARRLLSDDGEFPAIAKRHAEHFAGLVTAAAETWTATPSRIWVPALEFELENFRAALRWCVADANAPAVGARLACGLFEFWRILRLVDEGIAALGPLLAMRSLPDSLRASVHVVCARLLLDNSQPRDALPVAQRAAELAQIAGETLLLARAVQSIAMAKIETLADPNAGLEGLGRALELYQKIGNRQGQAEVHNALGICHHSMGETGPALRHYAESLRIFRSLGSDLGASGALSNIGALYYMQGEYEKAECYFHECLIRCERHVSVRRLDMSLLNLGEVSVTRGKIAAGRALLTRALHLLAIAPDPWVLATVLSNVARIRLHDGAPEEAVRIAAAADAIYERLAQPRQPTQQRIYRELLDAARLLLGPTVFSRVYDEGHAMTTEAAIDAAASGLPRRSPSA